MPDRGASPVWAAIAAGGLSAVMLWASSPPVGVSSLAWVALVPAASMVRANPGTRAGRLAVALIYALYLELLLVPALPLGLTYGQWGDPRSRCSSVARLCSPWRFWRSPCSAPRCMRSISVSPGSGLGPGPGWRR